MNDRFQSKTALMDKQTSPRKVAGLASPFFLASVRGRIIAGFGLLVLILATGAAGSAWLAREHQSAITTANHEAIALSLFRDAKADGALAMSLLQLYATTGDETLVPEIRSSAASTVRNLSATYAEHRAHGHEEYAESLRPFMSAAALMSDTTEEVIALRQSGDVQGAAATFEAVAPALRRLRPMFDEAAAEELRELTELQTQARRTGNVALWFAAVGGVASAVLALAAAALIAHSILRPLSRLKATALAVVAGDLEARAPATGPLELAHLGTSLNRMTESLLDASKRRELEAERERAYAQLRQSEEYFRSLIENASDIITVLESDGAIRYTSPSVQRVLGYQPEELRGKNAFDFIHPDDLPDVLGNFSLLVQDPSGPQSVEFRFRHADGSWRTLEAIGRNAIDNPAVAGVVVNSRDITAHNQAEEELRESAERTRLIVETAYDALVSIDAGGVITAWNSAAEAIFGWSREEAIGRIMADTILPPQYREAHLKGLQRFLATGEGPVLNQRIEIIALHRDGHEFPVELAVWAVRSGDAFTFNAFVHDITARKRAEEELRRLNQALEKEQKEIEALNCSLERKVKKRTRELRIANRELLNRNRQLLDARAQAATDGLTGLLNHRAFQERVRDEFSRAPANGTEIGMIMMDIDGFKRINDSLGHQAGDQILRQIATTLTDAAKGKDTYRYGGDEFAVLLPAADHRKTARIAERLRRAVERGVEVNGTKVTISLGIASLPDVATSADELIYGADAAMYWAKSMGKNQVGDWGKLLKHRADGTLPWYATDRAVRAPDVVAALVGALAAKDPATASHTERCSWYTARLGKEIGLKDDETSIVRLASLLHDIGKLAIRDEVLCKPGPLNEEEWAQMKQHPTSALHVLSQIRSISDATPAILHHHEHFDGSGYPDGLAGEDIPIASRILLVTDAFDAMTTDRPYRKAMSIEIAVEELKRNSGTQFDPAIVDAFLRILARHGSLPLRETAPAAAQSVVTTARRRQNGAKTSGRRPGAAVSARGGDT